MAEEPETKEEGKEEEGKDDNSKEDDDKDKIVTDLDRADQIAERQKRENDRREKLLQREENLVARKTIGGSAEAGQETKPVDKELEKKKKAAEFFKGTKLEKDIMNDVKE